MHYSFFAYLFVIGSCVAAIGAMRFSCVASAAHFLFFRKEIFCHTTSNPRLLGVKENKRTKTKNNEKGVKK